MPTETFATSSRPGPVSVVVMAPPGRLLDSLLRLLASLPGVQAVQQAADALAVLVVLDRAAPQLLILDWEQWGAEAEALLRQIRGQAPRLMCVGVVNGQNQQAAAWRAGVETVLLRGFSVQDLEMVVQRCALAAEIPGPPDQTLAARAPDREGGCQSASASGAS